MELEENDPDPIVASYNVFLNPSLPSGRKLYVLQQPNRAEPKHAPPVEMRLKPGSGMVELDIPIDYQQSYDKEKGLKWGRTLKSSMVAKNGGSHGLAGGFGLGAPPPRPKKRGEGDVDEDAYLDWTEAVRQDRILRTQTLGGLAPDSKEVQYMIGVFQDGDLHLTPVSNLVHLRPQLHHIDAVVQQERLANSQAASKEAAAAAAASTGNAAGGTGTGARAIHMTIKTTGDGDSVVTETMADRLRSVQTEGWRKLKYTDENDEAAWQVYQESLILPPTVPSGEAEGGEGESAKESKSLAEHVPRLETSWNDDALLEAVSGIKRPWPDLKVKPDVKEVEAAGKTKADGKAAEPKKTRARAPRATASKRGGKAKAASSKSGNSTTMDLTDA